MCALPVSLPFYDATTQVPPPPPMPTLLLNPGGTLYLHSALVERLSLRPGQPINLLPPTWNSLFWHLDLRPTAPRTITWYKDQRPRVEKVSLPPGLVLEKLTLHLMPGEPAYADVYPLLPANALTS